MKPLTLIALICFVVAANCGKQLRQNHDFISLSDLAPSDLSGLLNGNMGSLLPSSLQGLASKIFGEEEQQGSQGFLDKAKNFFGGSSSSNYNSNSNSNGGIFGGLSSLFGDAEKEYQQNGQQEQASGLSGLFNRFTSAFGGNENNNYNNYNNGGSSGSSGLSDLFGFGNGFNGQPNNNGYNQPQEEKGFFSSLFGHQEATHW